MIIEYFKELFLQNFGHNPTAEQHIAIDRLTHFIMDESEGGRGLTGEVFVLSGYAGTGKTSVVAGLVKTMLQLERKCVLLAPTGRAAKVFAAYAGHPAFTIHKHIYRQRSMEMDSGFSIDFNPLQHALFIVDEASMISNDASGSSYGTGRLLDDLIQYVYSGTGCRLILLGDSAQLPPVGDVFSPALQPNVLRSYGLHVTDVNLTQVVRQDQESGILLNATNIRQIISQQAGSAIGSGTTGINVKWTHDVENVPGNELIETLSNSYHRSGTDDTIVVCRSNKRAHIYNMGIRNQILYREEELSRGDIIMIAKNNYYWLRQASGLGDMAAEGAGTEGQTGEEGAMAAPFLANGDIARVVRVRNERELYGFRFADCTLILPDYDDLELTVTVLLDTLHSEAPSLSREQQEQLYNKVMEDYADIPYKRERLKKLREDPYYNALQIKYAYAVTCHKAQGGQWSEVYIDQGYITPEMMDLDYYRWLYTAFTRATQQIYLVNWRNNNDDD